ncbi:MAG: hypothetical protein JSS07_09595 [Proteobacteria bacterium]|nr:hypothetical protein [Pseudomonadota bacterium]
MAGGQIIDEVDEHHFDKIMNINLKGAYLRFKKQCPF